jgi:hypothetical protein
MPAQVYSVVTSLASFRSLYLLSRQERAGVLPLGKNSATPPWGVGCRSVASEANGFQTAFTLLLYSFLGGSWQSPIPVGMRRLS